MFIAGLKRRQNTCSRGEKLLGHIYFVASLFAKIRP
jgi:hypothetical protein